MLNCLKVEPESQVPYPKNFGGKTWAHQGTCKSTTVIVYMDESKVPVKMFDHCRKLLGKWVSAYDGKSFTKPTNGALEIDHLVPKEEAWASGASTWSDARRLAYKNDIGYAPSLIAVSRHQNRSKQNQEPGFGKGHYLPPLTSYRCTYISAWISVKYRWSLSVDADEKTVLKSMLKGCVGNIKIPMPHKAVIL